MPAWIAVVALGLLPAKLLLLAELVLIRLQAGRGLSRPGPLVHPASLAGGSPATGELAVTVLVAYRNEGPTLGRLLECLACQSCGPATFRVILVDDGSTDGGLGPGFDPASTGLDLLLLKSPGRGKTAALAEGVRHAGPGILLYTDGDCLPEPDWVRAHREAHARGARVVLGHVRVAGPPLAVLESLVASAQMLAGCAIGRPPFSRGGNWSLRREDLEAVGGYADLLDQPSGDDLYLLERLLDHKPPLALLTAAGSRVHTRAPETTAERRGQRDRRYGKLPGLRGWQRARHLLLAAALLALLLELVAGLAGAAPWALPQALLFAGLAWWGLSRTALLLGEPVKGLALRLPLWPLLMLSHALRGTLAGYRWKDLPASGKGPR